MAKKNVIEEEVSNGMPVEGGSGEFNLNLADLNDYVEEDLDLSVNSDEYPPPPPPGMYRCVADFQSEEEDKRFFAKPDKKTQKPVLATNLKIKVIGAHDPNLEERHYINRLVYKYISSRPRDGRSEITDLLKATGQLGKFDPRPTFSQMQEMITDLVINQREFDVKLDWEGSGKTESLTDDNGNAFYVTPKEFNSYSKWPKNEEGNPERSIEVEFQHPATGEHETVTLTPRSRLLSFLPHREAAA